MQQYELEELQNLVNATDDTALSCMLEQLWRETDYRADGVGLYKKELVPVFSGIRNATKKTDLRLQLNRLLKIASLLLIPVLFALSVYLYHDRKQLSLMGLNEVVVDVAKGQKATVTLPDGSTAFLNSESTLRYHQNYGLQERQVSLQGEAFFNVRKDSTKTFTVFTECLTIEVLGTSFNVYAYETEEVIEMALVSGHVKIETHAKPSKTIFVHPNEKMLYDKISGKLHLEKTNTHFDTAWMRGELAFRSEPIQNVFTKIERKYGVRIHLEAGDFKDDQFTGYIDSDQILDVMKNLQKHYTFSYKIKGEDIWIFVDD